MIDATNESERLWAQLAEWEEMVAEMVDETPWTPGPEWTRGAGGRWERLVI